MDGVNINENFWIPMAVSFFVSFFGFLGLLFARKTSSRLIRSCFYVPARKSVTDAVQLGGLPLSLGMISSIIVMLNMETLSKEFGLTELSTMKYWCISAAVIVVYGYLDDKFELRPIVKLIMQCLCVSIYAIFCSRVLFPQFSTVAFLILGFWGLGVVNGSNLLDGLDTLTIKLGGVTLGSYALIGILFSSAIITMSAVTLTLPLAAFYFFNREPAKMHLGEIGGSFVGFSALLLSSFVFTRLQTLGMRPFESFAMAVIPLSLPMVELGVSFLRRIYNRKSPFRGDKYHVHHILKNYYNFSASNVANIMAGTYALTIISSLWLIDYVGPISGGLVFCTILVFEYIYVGRHHWSTESAIKLTPKDLFNTLRKKDIAVINSLEVDEFELFIISENEDWDGHETYDDLGEEIDKKKAA